MSTASGSVDAEAPLAALGEVPRLRTATLRLTYRAEDRVHLPSPPASVWRGQLGHFLHRMAPTVHHAQDLSLYQRLFRTPASAVGVPDVGGHVLGPLGLAGEHVPHPFVLRLADPVAPATALTLTPREEARVEMVLVEDTVRHLPQLAAAFEALGTDGFGQRTDQSTGSRRRGRIALTAATLDLGGVELTLYDGQDWSLPPTCSSDLYEQAAALAPEPTDTVPEDKEALVVAFRTPCRLKYGGDVLRPKAVTPDALAATLSRRVLGLAVCYGPDAPDEAHLTAQLDAFRGLAGATTLKANDLEWAADVRYSHRQERQHPVGGLTGRVALQGRAEVRATWHRWLRLATRVHLGTKTAMGLGRIELRRGVES